MRETLACTVVLLLKNANVRMCPESATWPDELLSIDALSHDRAVESCRECTQRISTMLAVCEADIVTLDYGCQGMQPPDPKSQPEATAHSAGV